MIVFAFYFFDQEIYRMWVKIFAFTFGMGIVSGLVMSYQFGTNWSGFSDKAENNFGPLLRFAFVPKNKV